MVDDNEDREHIERVASACYDASQGAQVGLAQGQTWLPFEKLSAFTKTKWRRVAIAAITAIEKETRGNVRR